MTSKAKILVSDDLAEDGLKILQAHPALDVTYKPGMKGPELLAVIGEYEGLVIRSATTVTKEVVEAAKKLRVIGRAGIGVDNVDVPAATARGIIVMNTPSGNATTTAEHALALMISMARKIPQATALMKQGKWDKKKFMGTELTSKTLGVVGLGNIGKILADRARGLKMAVVAYDPFLTAEVAEKIGVEKVELPELYKRADFISVHTPLTDQTRGLIGKTAFDQMKKGVRIVNAARGGIVDEAALLEALESGKVGGAALDVFVEEPPPANHPLVMHERVICTPHLGASTDEAQVKVAIEIAEQFGDFFQTGQIRNSVNVPALSADLLKQLQPYFQLGEKLGSLLGQLHKETIEEIDCRFEGEIAEYDVKPISTAIVRGILAPMLDLSVNYVNAPSIAKDRGIKLVTSKSSESVDFTNLVTVTVRGGKSTLSVSGTILGRSAPRVTKFDDFWLEASPNGTILVLRNYDRPGVVGALGTTLGKNKVNIARMQLGLKPGGDEAVSFINIDSPAPQSVLDEIAKLPNMISVRQVKL